MTQNVELCTSVKLWTMHETNLLHVISPGHSKIFHNNKSRQKNSTSLTQRDILVLIYLHFLQGSYKVSSYMSHLFLSYVQLKHEWSELYTITIRIRSVVDYSYCSTLPNDFRSRYPFIEIKKEIVFLSEILLAIIENS